jgi:hypothetical protein
VTEVDALVAAVDTENQAVYGYGLAGAHFAGRDRADALAALDTHRTRHDRLSALVTRQGATPPVAAPAYTPPFPVVDVASARSVCVALEDACAGAAWDLAAASGPASQSRSLAVAWLTDSALAAARWRSAVESNPDLPGQPG